MEMKTIYLIISNNHITIKEHILNILKDNSLTEEYLINYDMNDISLDTVINDLDTYNFLMPKKVVVCNNCSFLSPTKNKGAIEQNLNSFTKYINNPSSENILILICDKLDERKQIVKLLKEKAEIISKEVSIRNLIKLHLDSCKMSNFVIEYLIDYCGNDYDKILNELEKLKCYKLDEEITKEDIDKIVLKSFNDNVFSLVDAIMRRNKKRAVNLYNELIEQGEDINKLVSLLAEQFRMIYNGKILLKEHNNNFKEVANILGVHPYRFQKAIESSYNYTLSDILHNLEIIDDMEIAMKTGKSTLACFEVFIYSL